MLTKAHSFAVLSTHTDLTQKCSACSLDEELDFYELLSGHGIDGAGVEEFHSCEYW